jgi:hypothetical protein
VKNLVGSKTDAERGDGANVPYAAVEKGDLKSQYFGNDFEMGVLFICMYFTAIYSLLSD